MQTLLSGIYNVQGQDNQRETYKIPKGEVSSESGSIPKTFMDSFRGKNINVFSFGFF